MFNYFEPTPILTCFSLILYLYIVLANWKLVQKKSFIQHKSNKFFSYIFFVVLLFAMIPFFSGDFYHYIEWVENANVQWVINPLSHIEVAYQYISSFVNGAYFPFRFIVWGSEIVLICITAKRLNINIELALYLVLLLFPVLYSYARASLAMSIYFYGLSYIIKPAHNRLLSYFLGLLITIICPFFHRSMYLLIAISPIVILPLFYSLRSTWKLLIYIIGIIVIVYAFSKILLYLDLVEILGDETLQHKLESYSEREVIEKGLAGKLKTMFEHIFRWGSLYLFYKYCLRYIRKKNTLIEILFVFSITISLIGLTFSFCGDEFYTLSYRISAMYFIPFSLMIAYSHQYNILRSIQMKRICYLALAYNFYYLSYSVYLSIVK